MAAASFGDRVQPETVCLILAMRTSLSGLAFLNATSELRLNRRISVSQLVKVKCRFSTSETAMPPRLPRVRRGGSANSCFAVVQMVRRERGPLNALRPKRADDRSERYKASKPKLPEMCGPRWRPLSSAPPAPSAACPTRPWLVAGSAPVSHRAASASGSPAPETSPPGSSASRRTGTGQH